ncbi:hypothetical protein Tco_0332471, partial [Tanacetum coccineum]
MLYKLFQSISSDVAELKDMVRALILDRKNQTPASAPVKAVEQSCVTCGGGHSYQNCPATNSNHCTMTHPSVCVKAAAVPFLTQANSGYRPPMVSNQIRPPGFPPVQNPHANFNRGNNFNQNRGNNFNQANDAVLRNMQNLSSYFRFWDTLPGKLLPTKEDLKAVILNKLPKKLGDPGRFLIPCEFTGITTCNALADLGASINLMPYSALTLRVGKEAITFNLDQTSKYTADYNHMTVNKIDVIDMACDEYSQEVLGFSSVVASGNPTPYFEPIVSTASPALTPFGDSDFLLMEEADSFLALEDDPTSSEVDPTYQDPEGDILILEAILNSEPPPPLPNHEQYMPGGRKELKLCEAKTVEPSINEPPEVELKELPPHLEYAFFRMGVDLYMINLPSSISFAKKVAKAMIMRWDLLLLEFVLKIRDKKELRISAAISVRLENSTSRQTENTKEINEAFPSRNSWFRLLSQLKVPHGLQTLQIPWGKIRDMTLCFWPRSFRTFSKALSQWTYCGDHYGANYTQEKSFDSGFYWPTILQGYALYEFVTVVTLYSRIVKALDSVIFNSSFTSSASFWEF